MRFQHTLSLSRPIKVSQIYPHRSPYSLIYFVGRPLILTRVSFFTSSQLPECLLPATACTPPAMVLAQPDPVAPSKHRPCQRVSDVGRVKKSQGGMFLGILHPRNPDKYCSSCRGDSGSDVKFDITANSLRYYFSPVSSLRP